jgi:hypothetical protein
LSTHDPDRGGTATAARGAGGAAAHRPVTGAARQRRSTETKAAFKTTELIAYIVASAAVLIAALILDESDAGGFGARQAWLYFTILTVGYMISRGLAKSGSHEPDDDPRTGGSRDDRDR